MDAPCVAHKAYGHRWSMLGLVDALDRDCCRILPTPTGARQVRIAKLTTPYRGFGHYRQPLLREARGPCTGRRHGAEDIIQIVYLRLKSAMGWRSTRYPTTPWFLAMSVDALRRRIRDDAERIWMWSRIDAGRSNNARRRTALPTMAQSF